MQNTLTRENVLEHLRQKVRGKGSMFWSNRIAQSLGHPVSSVEEHLLSLVEQGYLTTSWIFIDKNDESYEIPEEDLLEYQRDGRFYHPDTGDLVHNPQWFIRQDFLATDKLAKLSYFRADGWYDDNTYVIRVRDIDKLKGFLGGFGLTFVKEKHGGGPEHYACERDGKVLEVYPA